MVGRLRLAVILLALCLTFVLASPDAPAPALALAGRSEIDTPAGRLVKRRRHNRHRSRRHRKKSSHHRRHKSSHKSSHHSHKTSHKAHVTPSNTIRGEPIPRELQSFVRQAFKARKCQHQLDTEKDGFQSSGGSPNPHYCGSSSKDTKAVWWVANMDVDCDGTTKCPGNPDGQSQTAATFRGSFLDAAVVPYVVINQQSSFNFEDFGLKLLSPVTVICNGKMFSAVIGDTNAVSQMGEGSIALAKACFPHDNITGNNAAPNQVLYIAHSGQAMDSLSPSKISADASRLISKLQF